MKKAKESSVNKSGIQQGDFDDENESGNRKDSESEDKEIEIRRNMDKSINKELKSTITTN